MKAIYVGVMLSDPEKLLSWWEREVGELLQKKISHHMTIKFKPSPEDLSELTLGQEVGLRVVGWVDDGTIQAVAVEPEGVVSHNRIPHVTVATDGVTSPVKSNTLLEEGFTRIQGPTLKGRIGVFDGKQDIFS
jgi:hypothetical protein